MAPQAPILTNDTERPLMNLTAQKQGGSIAIILRADAAREIGLEPSDLDTGDSLQFFASKSREFEGRLLLDLQP